MPFLAMIDNSGGQRQTPTHMCGLDRKRYFNMDGWICK